MSKRNESRWSFLSETRFRSYAMQNNSCFLKTLSGVQVFYFHVWCYARTKGLWTAALIYWNISDQSCISAVFTPFMEHMPYILLLQTLVLIIVEKFTFKIPRIAQKVERFYQNIVEESLFGKDPVRSNPLMTSKGRLWV